MSEQPAAGETPPDEPPADPPAPGQPPPESGAPPGGPALDARRLHPAGAIMAALDNVRDALVSIVVLVVIGSQSGRLGSLVVVFGTIGAIAAAAVGYARWRAETYAIADESIRHRHGVISPDETVVPLSRVHSIDTAQGPIQRLFGVFELHVQTAGGGERGEIVLRAVTPAETERLRAAAGVPDQATRDLPAWRLSTAGLLVVGLTAPQLGMLLPLVGGAVAFGDNIFGAESARETVADRLPSDPATIALLVAAAIAVGWLLSFLGALVAFGGFAVVRDGDHLRIQRGFLRRRAASVPLRRIHAVSVAEGPLRRPFGLCSVRLETAGYGREAAAARTLFPLLPMAEFDARLAELVPALAADARDGPALPLERPPTRAARRYVLPRVLAAAAAGAVATAIWPVAWPAIPVLALLAAADGLARYRAAGWRLDAGRLALRFGSLTRRTVLARATRLQDHGFAQNPFQRRAELADVSITVASGTTAAVAHLDAAVSAALFDRLRPAP